MELGRYGPSPKSWESGAVAMSRRHRHCQKRRPSVLSFFPRATIRYILGSKSYLRQSIGTHRAIRKNCASFFPLILSLSFFASFLWGHYRRNACTWIPRAPDLSITYTTLSIQIVGADAVMTMSGNLNDGLNNLLVVLADSQVHESKWATISQVVICSSFGSSFRYRTLHRKCAALALIFFCSPSCSYTSRHWALQGLVYV